jgi:hypothetical protein
MCNCNINMIYCYKIWYLLQIPGYYYKVQNICTNSRVLLQIPGYRYKLYVITNTGILLQVPLYYFEV